MANKVQENTEFVNPFQAGISYEEFLNAIPKGVKVSEYGKDKLTPDQIEWLENDLTHYQNNLKK